MENIQIYLGIDNGLTGGIVALSPHGKIISTLVMPTKTITRPARKTTKEKTDKEINSVHLDHFIRELNTDACNILAVFEECPYHASSSIAMRSMAISAGKIIAVLDKNKIKTIRILNHDWQKPMLGTVPKGKTKLFARARSKEIWGGDIFLATSRSKVAHSGLVDASLIAEFERRKREKGGVK